MKDKDRFATYLGIFLLSVVVGSAAVFAGMNLRRRRRVRIRWRKVGGLKSLKDAGSGEVFALVIGGVLLHIGRVGGDLERSVREALKRRYPDGKRVPRNLKVYVGKAYDAPESVRRNVASLLVAILQPPWNLPEEGNYRGEVPIEVRNEGEVPPGIKSTLNL